MCTRHNFNYYTLRTVAIAGVAVNFLFLNPIGKIISAAFFGMTPNYEGYTLQGSVMKMTMSFPIHDKSRVSIGLDGMGRDTFSVDGGPENRLENILDAAGNPVSPDLWEPILENLAGLAGCANHHPHDE